jgi:kumamolisin
MRRGSRGASTPRVRLTGHRRHRGLPKGARPLDPEAQIEVTLKLRAPRPGRESRRRLETLGRRPPRRSRHLSREDHAALFGAEPEAVAAIDAFALAHGLAVTAAHLGARSMRLAGTAAQLKRAFGVNLKRVRVGAVDCHAHAEEVTVPAHLRGVVSAIFGLDSRPLFGPHLAAGGGGLDAAAMCRLYGYPPAYDGTGQCVAVIEVNSANILGALGTGFQASDLDQFFSGLGLKTPAVASIAASAGAGNFYGVNSRADAEAALDIQMAGAAAPGASLAVYFGLNGEQGFHDAVAAAVHDTVRNPSVLSISWGQAEDTFSPAFVSEMDALFQDADRLGITVCASAGDLGSSGKDQDAADKVPHASFPASSPSVVACGGTSATIQDGAIVSESVWNGGYPTGAGGGGISEIFPIPPWQVSLGLPLSAQKGQKGRGVPDLAAHADQANGYRIVVGGALQSVGGTSAVTPLVAGLFARINQARKAAGHGPVAGATPILYTDPGAFKTITQGSNDIDGTFGKYSATNGWSACAGLGAPKGSSILSLFT